MKKSHFVDTAVYKVLVLFAVGTDCADHFDRFRDDIATDPPVNGADSDHGRRLAYVDVTAYNGL